MSNFDWLAARKIFLDDDKMEAFNERVAIKCESGISEEEAREQSLRLECHGLSRRYFDNLERP